MAQEIKGAPADETRPLAQAVEDPVIMGPKVPKGTRDAHPEQVWARERAFATILDIFRRHGAVAIDTPLFERREVLTGKYGEDSKLIYDLADQGGELLSLRYDLTAPFARYLATHGMDNLKRGQIAKVYRRDNPAMTHGRFREFYQCDFDIAGRYPSMVADAEVIKVACEVLQALRVGEFRVRISHRRLLDAVMEAVGVPKDKLRAVCSAIDKLDKESWDKVRAEMVKVKKLPENVADKLRAYVDASSGAAWTVAALRQDALLEKSEAAQTAMQELATLFSYLDVYECSPLLTFDLSLARGLDYYTGVIFEFVLVASAVTPTCPAGSTDAGGPTCPASSTDAAGPTCAASSTDAAGSKLSIGSIAAGGRYDDLVGSFRKSGQQVPSVGVSIGIERILALMDSSRDALKGKTRTQVLIATIGKSMHDGLRLRMQFANLLWKHDIRAEFMYNETPAPKKQVAYADANDIPWVVFIGEKELQSKTVTVRNMRRRHETSVSQNELVSFFTGKAATADLRRVDCPDV